MLEIMKQKALPESCEKSALKEKRFVQYSELLVDDKLYDYIYQLECELEWRKNASETDSAQTIHDKTASSENIELVTVQFELAKINGPPLSPDTVCTNPPAMRKLTLQLPECAGFKNNDAKSEVVVENAVEATETTVGSLGHHHHQKQKQKLPTTDTSSGMISSAVDELVKKTTAFAATSSNNDLRNYFNDGVAGGDRSKDLGYSSSDDNSFAPSDDEEYCVVAFEEDLAKRFDACTTSPNKDAAAENSSDQNKSTNYSGGGHNNHSSRHNDINNLNTNSSLTTNDIVNPDELIKQPSFSVGEIVEVFCAESHEWHRSKILICYYDNHFDVYSFFYDHILFAVPIKYVRPLRVFEDRVDFSCSDLSNVTRNSSVMDEIANRVFSNSLLPSNQKGDKNVNNTGDIATIGDAKGYNEEGTGIEVPNDVNSFYTVGGKIEVFLWDDLQTWLPATITQCHSNGSFSVEFEGGDCESGVVLGSMRLPATCGADAGDAYPGGCPSQSVVFSTAFTSNNKGNCNSWNNSNNSNSNSHYNGLASNSNNTNSSFAVGDKIEWDCNEDNWETYIHGVVGQAFGEGRPDDMAVVIYYDFFQGGEFQNCVACASLRKSTFLIGDVEKEECFEKAFCKKHPHIEKSFYDSEVQRHNSLNGYYDWKNSNDSGNVESAADFVVTVGERIEWDCNDDNWETYIHGEVVQVFGEGRLDDLAIIIYHDLEGSQFDVNVACARLRKCRSGRISTTEKAQRFRAAFAKRFPSQIQEVENKSSNDQKAGDDMRNIDDSVDFAAGAEVEVKIGQGRDSSWVAGFVNRRRTNGTFDISIRFPDGTAYIEDQVPIDMMRLNGTIGLRCTVTVNIASLRQHPFCEVEEWHAGVVVGTDADGFDVAYVVFGDRFEHYFLREHVRLIALPQENAVATTTSVAKTSRASTANEYLPIAETSPSITRHSFRTGRTKPLHSADRADEKEDSKEESEEREEKEDAEPYRYAVPPRLLVTKSRTSLIEDLHRVHNRSSNRGDDNVGIVDNRGIGMTDEAAAYLADISNTNARSGSKGTDSAEPSFRSTAEGRQRLKDKRNAQHSTVSGEYDVETNLARFEAAYAIQDELVALGFAKHLAFQATEQENCASAEDAINWILDFQATSGAEGN